MPHPLSVQHSKGCYPTSLSLKGELEGWKVRVETVESVNRFVRWALVAPPMGSTRGRLPWESTFIVRLRQDVIGGSSVRLCAILSHEFTHIRQRVGQVPVMRCWDPWGERKVLFEKICELHAQAKVGEVFPLRPVYLKVPETITKETWPSFARQAQNLAIAALKHGGGERSVAWWEGTFADVGSHPSEVKSDR